MGTAIYRGRDRYTGGEGETRYGRDRYIFSVQIASQHRATLKLDATDSRVFFPARDQQYDRNGTAFPRRPHRVPPESAVVYQYNVKTPPPLYRLSKLDYPTGRKKGDSLVKGIHQWETCRRELFTRKRVISVAVCCDRLAAGLRNAREKHRHSPRNVNTRGVTSNLRLGVALPSCAPLARQWFGAVHHQGFHHGLSDVLSSLVITRHTHTSHTHTRVRLWGYGRAPPEKPSITGLQNRQPNQTSVNMTHA